MVALGNLPCMANEWRKRLKSRVGGPGQPTMKGLSLEAKLGETFVRDILERDRVPTIDKFQRLATTLGTTVADLLGEETAAGTEVPVISWVSAGQIAAGEPTPDADWTITVQGLGPGEFFGLKVQGDSMDRYSPEGSVIIVNRSETDPLRGKPYVFGVKGEGATYKLWEPGPPARLEPYSTNPLNKPIYPDRRRKPVVIGRVRRTLLDL